VELLWSCCGGVGGVVVELVELVEIGGNWWSWSWWKLELVEAGGAVEIVTVRRSFSTRSFIMISQLNQCLFRQDV